MHYSRLIFPIIFSGLILVADSNASAKTPAKNSTPDKPVASSGNALKIVAVVGDQAISSFDLDSRVKFVVTTTKISNSPEVMANLKPQILRTLIDETLQLQEATKNNIVIDDTEITQAIAGLESQKGMPAGAIVKMLTANNIPLKTFKDQVRSQLAWGKLLSKSVRSRIKISDEEIALAQGRSLPSEEIAPAVIREMEISIITLPVDKPQRLPEVKKITEKLYGELRKGASFEEVARQFSAGGDGKSFWISPDQLDKNVAQVLKETKAGNITQPIPTRDGFIIVKLHNVKADKATAKKVDKTFEISMKEILLKLKDTASAKEADVLLQIGKEVAKNPGTCEEKGVANIGDLSDFDIEVNMRKAPLAELPPALQTISESIQIGEISSPFASAEGIRLYMLCGKKEIAANASYNSDKIRENLFREKFELEAQKYLRDLRRNVFIEIRE